MRTSRMTAALFRAGGCRNEPGARRRAPAVALVWLLAAAGAQGQDLTLFEPLQTEAAANNVAVSGPSLASQPQDAAAALLLRSSSRFGDDYHAVLVDQAGKTAALRWRTGQQVVLPEHPGYVVLEVDSAKVTLKQPAGRPCVADAARGVSCLNPDIAVLALATLSPLQPKAVPGNATMGPQPMPEDLDDGVLRDPAGNAVFINPFNGALLNEDEMTPEMQQARAERAQVRAQRLQQFQIERIPEDQVPPGMRLVRTPFGDRLVPIRE